MSLKKNVSLAFEKCNLQDKQIQIMKEALEKLADINNWSCDTDFQDNYHEEWTMREFPREIAEVALRKAQKEQL